MIQRKKQLMINRSSSQQFLNTIDNNLTQLLKFLKEIVFGLLYNCQVINKWKNKYFNLKFCLNVLLYYFRKTNYQCNNPNWFDPKLTTMPIIYNIFSNFENIYKIDTFQDQMQFLNKVFNLSQCKFLLTNFNEGNPTLFKEKGKMYLSNCEFIFYRNCEEGQLPKNTDEEEFYLDNETYFRYKDNNFKYMVAPSQQIMLTYLKKQFCEEGIFYDKFSMFDILEKIKIFFEEKTEINVSLDIQIWNLQLKQSPQCITMNLIREKFTFFFFQKES
ncbi:unnamed protein product [Paramecium sonneborni]|uniref:Uncharacterized protein n=1 Tax=Paramecium sonneborni TaxID=65129 RepID=A0A8S1MPC6_9CILI|nr:unnamed protein product [Paramecium sonneborni]